MKAKGGSSYETDKNDYVYFHTNLNKKERNMDENIKLVIETVIICEREYRNAKDVKFLSGGYSVFQPFKSKNDGQLIDVYEGTPRDLITGIEADKSSAQISLQFKSCPQLDYLKDLVPVNNLVS